MTQSEQILAQAVLNAGPYINWNLQTASEHLNDTRVGKSKRSLERVIAKIDWLRCSRKAEMQINEEGARALQVVFSSLITGARKARRAAFFAQLHPFAFSELENKNESVVSAEPQKSPLHWILVIEDGKGKKNWCLIDDPGPEAVSKALSALTKGRPSTIFPSGHLVQICRTLAAEYSAGDQTTVSFALTQFPEPQVAIQLSTRDDVIMSAKRTTKMTHLDRLEAESIHIIREVMAHAENPVMLYSVGKDSSVMLHLARKAFYPSPPPFPLMHVDTRWKFKAMYEFRDQMAAESGMDLIIHVNPEGIEKNINPFDHGSALHTDIMKTQGLKQALDLHQFDVAFGGARRDEEKSRAKERIFSFRSAAHRWDPKNQRPELWNLYNCRKAPGESVRVFPLSNWTELDIWQYIYREQIPIVPLYFAAERPVVDRNGFLMMVDDERMQLLPGEIIEPRLVRFRTLGCYPLTGAVESTATDLSQIVLELLQSRTSERQGRAIDSDGSASMEKKKQEGYF